MTGARLWSLDAARPRLVPRSGLRTTYLVRVRDGQLKSLGSRTSPLGWMHDGRAVVAFANGCGSPPQPPGIYLVSAAGRVLTRTLAMPERNLAVALWTS